MSDESSIFDRLQIDMDADQISRAADSLHTQADAELRISNALARQLGATSTEQAFLAYVDGDAAQRDAIQAMAADSRFEAEAGRVFGDQG